MSEKILAVKVGIKALLLRMAAAPSELFDYFRPGGVDAYLRPDGTSKYKREI